ncbi:protein SRG1-like [Dioscorea cayenensis subsp. rotundata]|uniref:Protein SRG1-like n=1 Tax=Dioscorea cayennensis subsp. rotundata TaxID=55577 RepID=A0AB40ARW1_DIOCR|nr:protein SRG1-like [Dioscorea cayenensis subsp. rotundata]
MIMSEQEMKMVQEMAENQEEPPLRYIWRDSDEPVDDVPPIPAVHLGRPDEAEQIKTAIQSWGMFQVIEHGMTPSFLDEVRDVTKAFFELPRDEKQKYSNMKNGNFQFEGYGNDEVATEDQILDWNDRLFLTVQPEDIRKLELWPENPSSFRVVLSEFSTKTRKLLDDVLKAMAKSLELDEDSFIRQFGDRPLLDARFNNYPCCRRPDLVIGVKPHSDSSGLTIILPDKDVEGLQVMKDGVWVKIITDPHALIVNMGDQMEIISNGIFKSPLHRVVTNTEKHRISIAMFYTPEGETEIGPADGLVSDTKPRLYKTMKSKDYLGIFFPRYLLGKTTIHLVKI